MYSYIILHTLACFRLFQIQKINDKAEPAVNANSFYGLTNVKIFFRRYMWIFQCGKYRWKLRTLECRFLQNIFSWTSTKTTRLLKAYYCTKGTLQFVLFIYCNPYVVRNTLFRNVMKNKFIFAWNLFHNIKAQTYIIQIFLIYNFWIL